MPYSVDFITFKVVDKKVAGRTAIQEQVLQPLRACHLGGMGQGEDVRTDSLYAGAVLPARRQAAGSNALRA